MGSNPTALIIQYLVWLKALKAPKYLNSLENLRRRLNKKSFYTRIKYKLLKPYIGSWCSGIGIPLGWQYVAFKNREKPLYKFFYYSKNYYISFGLLTATKTSVKIDTSSAIIMFYSYFVNGGFHLFWKWLKKVLYTTTYKYALRIIFKGKGYYLYRNKRNTLTPQFGYAHRMFFYSYFTRIVYLRKTKFVFHSSSFYDLRVAGHGLISLRPINIFTGRGVRFRKQTVYKKDGKISTYV